MNQRGATEISHDLSPRDEVNVGCVFHGELLDTKDPFNGNDLLQSLKFE